MLAVLSALAVGSTPAPPPTPSPRGAVAEPDTQAAGFSGLVLDVALYEDFSHAHRPRTDRGGSVGVRADFDAPDTAMSLHLEAGVESGPRQFLRDTGRSDGLLTEEIRDSVYPRVGWGASWAPRLGPVRFLLGVTLLYGLGLPAAAEQSEAFRSVSRLHAGARLPLPFVDALQVELALRHAIHDVWSTDLWRGGAFSGGPEVAFGLRWSP